MFYGIVAAELRVFVFQRVETVRTGGNDVFHFVTIEHLNVHHRLHLEEEFVSSALGGISRTPFFGS